MIISQSNQGNEDVREKKTLGVLPVKTNKGFKQQTTNKGKKPEKGQKGRREDFDYQKSCHPPIPHACLDGCIQT